MLDATDLQAASRALALGVTMISAFLGLRQWYEHKGRLAPSSSEDAGYFRRQDVRRWLGVGVMLSLALVVFVGSWVEPRIDGKGNPRFVVVWLVVLILIVVMLVLALLDWLATRIYARRHRRAMFRREIEELRQQLHQAASRSRGDGSVAPPELPVDED